MEDDIFSGENSVVFEIKGRKIRIDGLDELFYTVYKMGVSSGELLKEGLKSELVRSGRVPGDIADEAAELLMDIYRENMERAGSINFG